MDKQSPSFRLSKTDIIKWGKNTVVFFSPSVLIYLLSVQTALSDGYQPSDFYLTQVTFGAISGWFIATCIDFFKKLVQGPTE